MLALALLGVVTAYLLFVVQPEVQRAPARAARVARVYRSIILVWHKPKK